VNKEIILVVEDNHQLADFIAQTLLPEMGYEARTAYTGKGARQIIQSSPPSLVLLDLELPDTNGLEMLRQLNVEGYNVPTILVTAHGSEQIAADAFRLGIQDYLIKPVRTEDLEAAISRALTETRLRQETIHLTAQLQEQVNWLNALSRISQTITSTLDLDEVLRRIVEAGVLFTQAEEGFLALVDKSSGQLYLRAAKNIEEDKIRTMRLPMDDSMVGEVISTGKPKREFSKSENALLKVSTGFLVRGLIHVPILSKGHPLGVLSVDNRTSLHPFTIKDVTKLSSLADHAAVALENANLYLQARQEIAVRKRIEAALRESEERYALAVRGANDGIWDWDFKSNRIYFSPRWKDMLGYSETEIGNNPFEWFNRVHKKDIERLKLSLSAHLRGLSPHFENEYRIRHRDGSYRWVLNRGLAVRDSNGAVNRIAGSQTDISERKSAEAKLLHDAFYDRLTGLANRALFMDHLKNAINRFERHKGENFAVLFLDLDQFKDVNDSLGHPAGDELLIAIANILRSNFRTTDTVARFGGDEFVILLEDINDSVAALTVSEWIIKKLSAPIRIGKNNVLITASIGIVMGSPDYEQPEDMLRDADIAMYAAKAQGKSNCELFNPIMRDRIIKRVAIESDFQQAIEKKQIRAFYQPIIALQTGQLTSFEVLARWNNPERGLVTASEFIPLALETGLVVPMDWWILEEACRQLKDWQARFQFNPMLKINVNITSKSIVQANFIKNIKQILHRTGLGEQSLELEITENAVITNYNIAIEVITELKKLGINVQIDDFGTGYSTLMYLKKFPVTALKIDRTFVQQINDHGDNTEIVRMIIELTHDLDMKAIAEGIETEMQLIQLKALECDCGQGFFFSFPLEPESVTSLLESIKTGDFRFVT
jgi:diguanylate cyclase (GGDEF)-like protein/PAS domain S-box-containing protein